jgi:hypothetical protein
MHRQEYDKKYKAEHRDFYRDYSREYYHTPMGKFHGYKRTTKRRKLKWALTKEEFMTFWQKSCIYCGDTISTIGLDRIDNSKGYTLNNVVPCCWICNYMKNSRTKEEFLSQCRKIIAHDK